MPNEKQKIFRRKTLVFVDLLAWHRGYSWVLPFHLGLPLPLPLPYPPFGPGSPLSPLCSSVSLLSFGSQITFVPSPQDPPCLLFFPPSPVSPLSPLFLPSLLFAFFSLVAFVPFFALRARQSLKCRKFLFKCREFLYEAA